MHSTTIWNCKVHSGMCGILREYIVMLNGIASIIMVSIETIIMLNRVSANDDVVI